MRVPVRLHQMDMSKTRVLKSENSLVVLASALSRARTCTAGAGSFTSQMTTQCPRRKNSSAYLAVEGPREDRSYSQLLQTAGVIPAKFHLLFHHWLKAS